MAKLRTLGESFRSRGAVARVALVETAETPGKLFAEAQAAARNAYAPYSEFCVGAAVETADGNIYRGANMENISYGLTICAEAGALQAASSAGQLAQVVRIALVGGKRSAAADPPSAPTIVTPCGRCRQLIFEAADLGKRDLEVWCADLELRAVRCFKISELLPHAFGPRNLSAG